MVSDVVLFTSKLAGKLISPLGITLCLLVLAVLLLLLTRKRLAGFALLAAIGLLCLAGNRYLSTWLLGTLEEQHPALSLERSPRADAIVLLGGGLGSPRLPEDSADLNAAGDRLIHALRLFKTGKAPWIIATGGWVFGGESSGSQAEIAARLLHELGVPREKILLLPDPRNTYEEAREVRSLIDERKFSSVLLVTSAFHMPRASEVFRTAGVHAVPSPTDFRSYHSPQPVLLGLIPESEALDQTTVALREYLGLVAYRLQGWID